MIVFSRDVLGQRGRDVGVAGRLLQLLEQWGGHLGGAWNISQCALGSLVPGFFELIEGLDPQTARADTRCVLDAAGLGVRGIGDAQD
jgi:hypothetical protein